jgi:hypothetical protein
MPAQNPCHNPASFWSGEGGASVRDLRFFLYGLYWHVAHGRSHVLMKAQRKRLSFIGAFGNALTPLARTPALLR